MKVNMQEDSVAVVTSSDDVSKLLEIVNSDINSHLHAELEEREEALMRLAYHYSRNNDSERLVSIIPLLKKHISVLTKARAVVLVQNMLQLFLDTDIVKGSAVELCEQCIEWAKQEHSRNLVHVLSLRLAELYFETRDYKKSSLLNNELIKELKVLDNKRQLVESYLLESKLYYVWGNVTKAKGSLASAKTAAASLYVAPKLQAELDMHVATVYAKDNDFNAAYSYFCESFDIYKASAPAKASKALKYMVLCKLMLNKPEQVIKLLNSRSTIGLVDSHVKAMESIANSCLKGSTKELYECLKAYENELGSDLVISDHIDSLTENLIRKNILAIIKPYSSIRLEYLAQKMEMGFNELVMKLSSMILDEVFYGSIDQEREILKVLESPKADTLLDDSLEFLASLESVVDSMSNKTDAYRYLC